MLHFFRQIEVSGRKPGVRNVIQAALHVEQLESRDVPAPLAPAGLLANGASASSIALSWNAPPDSSITGYDVYEKVRHVIYQPKGGSRSYYTYNLIASNLTKTTDTVTGLATGSYHTYLVTSVNSTGQSIYSAPATGETWIAPRLSSGSSTVLLSSGALWSSPVSATVGLTTQFSLLVSGNPLTYAIVSGPSTISIDPQTGVVTYTPDASEAGTASATFQASNPLGAVTQAVQFNVAGPDPTLATPTLSLSAASATYNGQYQQVSASAVGSDGVAPVAGALAIAYNGGKSSLLSAGTYQVLVTFTSSDASYGNATLLSTFTISKATPSFSYLSSPTIAVGTATTTVSGYISSGSAVPTAGDFVIVTLNGVAQDAIVNANSTFSVSFATGSLPAGSYSVGYAFAGDANFSAANDASTLTVVPLAAPQVTQNPSSATTTAGDPVSFTASATGSPTMTVQWQVSTDGGQTFTNVSSNASATTSTLSFYASAGQNGYKYRAIFTNSAGSATTSIATLTVEADSGGGD